mmetsp:Transcript_29604/g.81411  ORF Transcript_29604/g.81411 Transcript_29604/m.81411 type:complete len:279 (-) Transcript_29604:769-1605(-)
MCSLVMLPSTLSHSTSSLEPWLPSKSVWATVTVNRHVLFTMSLSLRSSAVLATQPGSLHWSLAIAFMGEAVSLLCQWTASATLLLPAGLASQVGWTKQFTMTTPLKRLPSTGHSSTIGEILPVMFSSPSLPTKPSSEKSSRHGRRASSPPTPQALARPCGWQRNRSARPLSCTSSTYSRLNSSSKSVGCTATVSLHCSCSSTAPSKTFRMALTSQPGAAQASVVLRLRCDHSRYLSLDSGEGSFPRPKASYWFTEESNHAAVLALVISYARSTFESGS